MRPPVGTLQWWRRHVWRAAAVVAAMAGVARPAVAQELATDVLDLRLVPGAGASAVAPFTVVNVTDRTIPVVITLQDWDRAENGDNRFYPVGTGPGSCGDRVRVAPMAFQLPPRGTRVVRVSVADDAPWPAACWLLAVVRSAEPPPVAPRNRTSVTYTFEIGVKAYVEPATLTRDGRLDDVRVEVDSAGRRHVVATFTSTGGLQVTPKGKLEIRRADNTVAASLDFGDLPTLPGARREVRVPVPALASGAYVGLVVFDFSGPEVLAGQVRLDVP